MKEPVLKAVAAPPKLFLAPLMLAVANLGIQFAFMFICFALQGKGGFNPLLFLITIFLVHLILMSLGAKEPHLTTILKAGGVSFKKTHNMIKYTGNKFSP